MTHRYPPPPPPLRGAGEIGAWLRRRQVRAVTLLTDPAVAAAEISAAVRQQIRAAGLTATPVPVRPGGDLDAVRHLADALAPGELVVAVGGGTTLDLAKLAALSSAHPEAMSRLSVPQRGGLVPLPPELGASVRVLAVPTTLGTGSELGFVACFGHGDGKRLAIGPCLRPEGAVWDARATATLPPEAVVDGVLEALFRTVSPYIGDPTPLPVQDALVETLARRLVRTGRETAAAIAAGRPVPGELRLRIAELSAESQIGHTNAGRDPHAVKAWAVANELSVVLGLPKMRALAVVWAAAWRRIAAGDTRYGDPDRMRALWRAVRTEAPELPTAPQDGLVALMRDWQTPLDLRAAPDQLDRAARRTVRAWGAGLPVLGELGVRDVRALLADATTPEPSPLRAGAPAP